MYFSPTRTELTEHIDDIKAGLNDREAEGILGKANYASSCEGSGKSEVTHIGSRYARDISRN